MNQTTAYYERNAEAYCNETCGFNVLELYKPFLAQLPNGGRILDLGCGSGRDSKAFLSDGYQVTAIDGCPQIARYAEKFIGQSVKAATFQELAYSNEFDGIWACASLLHCPRIQIINVLTRIAKALKPNGIAYMSFKWGDEETVDKRGRYFNNYTESSLQALFSQILTFAIIEVWTASKPLRGDKQKWVNALVKKVVDLT